MSATFKTIEEYFRTDRNFVIPNYQRGYKWAVNIADRESAVEKLLRNLIEAYTKNPEQSYFLQGVTVCEDNNDIILIDGQQRTTTLYLLLRCIDIKHIQTIKLRYDIRQKSKDFIENLKKNDFDYSKEPDDDNQDIFYLKKAIEQIDLKLKEFEASGESKEELCKYIVEKVNILYIRIDKEKATKTFSMMNGNKATMLPEELIKAEMLRIISLPDKSKKDVSTSAEENPIELKEIIAEDWEINALRSRYAREWDKWLYWWNKNDVREFFGVKNPMGLLLEYHYIQEKDHSTQTKLEKAMKSFSFDDFKLLLSGKEQTKEHFKKLRNLQKSFEDIFTKPKVHNYLKLSLICSKSLEDKFEIIQYFINTKSEEIMKDYAKWRLVGATHSETISSDDQVRKTKAEEALKSLSQIDVYRGAYDLAAKQLLRLNVEQDNDLGRKFDFSIYQERKSLEHIHPKSKAYHKVVNEDGTSVYKDGNEKEKTLDEIKDPEWLDRDTLTDCSEHSIGNLLLLHKDDNSKFSDNTFEEKKAIYFNIKENFNSRNLLHTISVFAKSKWKKAEIEENQAEFKTLFERDYEITKKDK